MGRGVEKRRFEWENGLAQSEVIFVITSEVILCVGYIRPQGKFFRNFK